MEKKYYSRRRDEKLSDHLEKKTDSWSLASKKKLTAAMRHKIKRTFVSALEAIDEELREGKIGKDVHGRLRSKILGAGNTQIRAMELELEDRYNVEALNYHITLPVKPIGE